MLQQLLLNTGIQWILFLFLPLIIYLIFFRNKMNVLSFLGLKRKKKVKKKLLIITTILSIFYLIFNIWLMIKNDVASDDVRFISFEHTGLSVETFLILIVHSVIRTSFLEEIVFRGFLINALNDKLNFPLSNNIQALVFTVIHFIGTIQMGLSIPTIVVANLGVYLLSIYFGQLTKESGYSIYYPAIFHGMINILAGLFLFLPFNH